jgi:hypothetical protein
VTAYCLVMMVMMMMMLSRRESVHIPNLGKGHLSTHQGPVYATVLFTFAMHFGQLDTITASLAMRSRRMIVSLVECRRREFRAP